MKRLHEILKPFLAIILGALLLLRYLNWLQGDGLWLAAGIVAMVLAAFYLGVGVVGFTLNNKLPEPAKKVFEVGAVVAFPLFMFLYFLFVTIRLADNNLGPNGWFLAILKMIACIAFASVYCVAAFVNNRHLNKFTLLLAAVFVLALLLAVLFDNFGDPVGLGGIIVVEVVIFFIYGNILFNSLPTKDFAQKQAEPEAEPEEEEAPAEEEQEA